MGALWEGLATPLLEPGPGPGLMPPVPESGFPRNWGEGGLGMRSWAWGLGLRLALGLGLARKFIFGNENCFEI